MFTNNYYEMKSDKQLEQVRWYDRKDNGFIKAVSERDTLSESEKVELLNGGMRVNSKFTGNIKKSLWDLVAMIAKGKDVEMTSNLNSAYAPLIKDSLVYTDKKRIVATVLDDELGNIEIDRYIKVLRISALGRHYSKSIIEKVSDHAKSEMEKFEKLGLL